MQPVEHRTASGVRVTYTPYPAARLARQLEFTELTGDDLAVIAGYRDHFLPRVPRMVDAFYDHLWSIPELRAIVQRFSSVDKLKKTLIEYLEWTVRGAVDQQYADYRYRVGAVHEKIGLAPQWYLGMFHVFEAHVVDLIRETARDPRHHDRSVLAFMKLLSLDMQLAMDAYIEAYTAERTRRLEKLKALRQSLADSSQDLAAAAEESSASSEEMAASVAQVAGDAHEVAAQSEEIRRSAEQGARRMQQVAGTIRQVAEQMAAMQQKVVLMAESSREMEGILRTVDGIAKQTNMLSLNAAIEAARAGQHGRGFAVVAEEVRKLSDRTSASLREIARLIATSNSHVQAVRETTVKAGSAASASAADAGTAEQEFAQIVALVAQGADRMAAIHHALQELAQMSANVQEGAEQSAQLATMLSSLARTSEE
ncbi:MAG TPA: globin-coupled sensor protein [Symbiobacteriaceae bacterium]|nr:globin-coupled sensor protein [Symbiobacteriaceae bacterium]